MIGLEPIYWHWLVLGVALVTLEILVPGVYLMWFGVAAIATGVTLWVDPSLTLNVQLLLFSALSVLSVAFETWLLRRRPIKSEDALLNRRGEQYVGRVLVLEHPIENGVGRVRVDDTIWRVEGPDLPGSARVRVVGVDGASLQVVPYAPGEATFDSI